MLLYNCSWEDIELLFYITQLLLFGENNGENNGEKQCN